MTRYTTGPARRPTAIGSKYWTGPIQSPVTPNPLMRLIPKKLPPAPSSDAHWLWCTVTSAWPDPVQVVPDASSDPLPGVPSMLCHVDLGDRVLVLLSGRRMYVLGVAQPDQSQNIPSASGMVDINVTTVGQVMTTAITFDQPFNQVPAVTTTPYTSVPQNVFATPRDVTTDGFTIYLYRSDVTGTTTVSWTATT